MAAKARTKQVANRTYRSPGLAAEEAGTRPTVATGGGRCTEMECALDPMRHVLPVRRNRHARRAVTLLEIILALGLLVVVSSMMYWFYASSLETTREGTAAAQKVRLARVVLTRLTAEIRQAAALTADNRLGIRGEAERIWLSTYRVPSRRQSENPTFRDEPPPAEYDLTKVEYKIVRHPEVLDEVDGYEYPLGLARVEIPIPRPDSAERGETEDGERRGRSASSLSQDAERLGIDVEELLEEQRLSEEQARGEPDLGPAIQWDELYAPEIRYLRFCYYDGHTWWDKWEVSGESPLPQLVSVTIGFEAHAPFGEQKGLDEINDEFCTCLGEDPVDCEPLAPDQYSTVVRVPQSDPLFRSRITREAQGLTDKLSAEQDAEAP